ncbi:electron transport complex subunit RsxG [Thermochromatium tepidum]|uniref:Ion-translocating oxidoreductase complex subunit G n=1 Tax=Thermochromatium tepidum ATCC 43061 TaxID=316276 RepID=A0A6I6EG67_THETI|nr:electron transport complex subunit RsxG [Thermochromatium tepidum]QGU33200.1 electron transport complex subunit RsxG [Thermochromatium tepidum ATCC 43061]
MSRLVVWREHLGYQGLSLALMALVASAALVIGDRLTAPAIEVAERRDFSASLAQVLPPGSYDNDLLQDQVQITPPDQRPVTLYRARLGQRITGVVFKTSARGYAGDIQLVLGIDPEGRLLGVQVTKHSETPGLGDKIERNKSNWVLAFTGKSLGDPAPERWAVKKDGGVFDQFTGATITPRATVKAIKLGLEFFAAHRQEILQ